MNDSQQQCQAICKSSDIEIGGKGVNFQVEIDNTELPAFVIRHGGIAYAYLNQCAHLHLELDWERGEFFDIDAEYIVCANHGAMFEPFSGECINGPCFGASLVQIQLSERDETVFIDDDGYRLVSVVDWTD